MDSEYLMHERKGCDEESFKITLFYVNYLNAGKKLTNHMKGLRGKTESRGDALYTVLAVADGTNVG